MLKSIGSIFLTGLIAAAILTAAGCRNGAGTADDPVKNSIELGVLAAEYSPGKTSTANEPAVIGPEAMIDPEEEKVVVIAKISFDSDKDGDGVNDLDDIVLGAREQIEKKPRYKSDYYKGGYPPDDIAVCTDIVWRAFMKAGYDLKSAVDEDIKNNVKKYPRVNDRPDPNIDFRRVRNLEVFFARHAQSLTTEIIPGDIENLRQWQGGDLVTFRWGGIDHIAVVSDKRNKEGVPYLIHTYGSYPVEDDRLLDWADTITHHFRYPRK